MLNTLGSASVLQDQIYSCKSGFCFISFDISAPMELMGKGSMKGCVQILSYSSSGESSLRNPPTPSPNGGGTDPDPKGSGGLSWDLDCFNGGSPSTEGLVSWRFCFCLCRFGSGLPSLYRCHW
jgi:hypothetical protein